jgi:hypothetical protein
MVGVSGRGRIVRLKEGQIGDVFRRKRVALLFAFMAEALGDPLGGLAYGLEGRGGAGNVVEAGDVAGEQKKAPLAGPSSQIPWHQN